MIGVVIPTFNGKNLLTETLVSVKEQTYRNFSVVVVDDGSVKSEEPYFTRATQGDQRFTFIRQENSGVSSSRNNGASQLSKKCRLLMFLDGDDLLFPNFLMEAREALAGDSADFFVGRAERFEKQVGDLDRFFGPKENFIAAMPEILLRTSQLVPSMTVMTREVWDELNGFRDSKVYMEDWDFFLRAVGLGKRFAFSDQILLGYRSLPGSRGSRSERNRIECAQTLRANRRTLKGGEKQARLTEARYWTDAARCVDRKNFGKRLRHLKEAVLAARGNPRVVAKCAQVLLPNLGKSRKAENE